jgi:hypothetical protein
MKFCRNCGTALEEPVAQKGMQAGPVPEPPKAAGRKKQYLLIAAIAVIILVAGLGYLFSQTTLSIRSDPSGAGVYLDSEFRGVTPCVIHTLLPGVYPLEFRHTGYPVWQKNITVTLGETTTINADLSDNLIPEVTVSCISTETKQDTGGITSCIYKKGEAVIVSGTAVRPHPKENPNVTISVSAQDSALPIKTENIAIRPDNTYNASFSSAQLPSGSYRLLASLPSGQRSTTAFTIETQEDTNIRLLRKIVEDYHRIHTYSIDDYFVCADMAMDVWNIVDTQGLKAVLVAGNIRNQNAGWKDYDHAWVLVEAAPKQWVALETTGGFLVYQSSNPGYYRGMFFENPKDLKTNMDLRRDYNNEIDRSNTIVNQYNAKVSEYNSERDTYITLVDTYNTKYAGQNLTAAEYQEALVMKNNLDTESQKVVQLKAELDQLTVTYNNEKQIMDSITRQIAELAAKGANLVNSG